MSAPRIIVAPQRSTWSSAACAFAALCMAAACVAFGLETQLDSVDRITAMSLCGFMGLAVGAMAWRLGYPRGGVLLDEQRDRVGLMLTGPGDVWWIPRSGCAGVRVSEPEPDRLTDQGLYGVVLDRVDGVEILLVETPDPALTEDAAEALRRGLALPSLTAPPATEPPALMTHTAWIRVARRVALHGVLTSFAVAMMGIGGILLTRIGTHPAVGIFLAPVALLAGGVLLALPLVKRLAREEISHDSGCWRHRWRLARWVWGEQSLELESPAWRLRVGGIRGSRLELVGTDGEIWIGAGATTRSHASVEDLCAFPHKFLAPTSEG